LHLVSHELLHVGLRHLSSIIHIALLVSVVKLRLLRHLRLTLHLHRLEGRLHLLRNEVESSAHGALHSVLLLRELEVRELVRLRDGLDDIGLLNLLDSHLLLIGRRRHHVHSLESHLLLVLHLDSCTALRSADDLNLSILQIS
jgi:hypothetical protein